MSRDFNPFDYPEIKVLFDELNSSLYTESSRGALLIATAHVDDQLTKLIEAVLPKDLTKNHKDRLLKYPGHLSSFSSKIELSYAFRLIGENLYDSLNALRKVRNDAAHSNSKIELSELNEKLKSVYNLGPGFSNFIRELSASAMLNYKIEGVKNVLNKLNWSPEKKQETLKKKIKEKANMELMEKQLPFWELVYGLTFLCGLLAYEKASILKLTKEIETLSDLNEIYK